MTIEETYIFGFRGLYRVFEVHCLGVIMIFCPDAVVTTCLQRIAEVIGDRLNVPPYD